MKVDIVKPNVIHFNLRYEPKDEIFRKCNFLRAALDLDNWSLEVNSDVGYYHYKWAPEQNRTFLDYMIETSRDSDYLLNKMSNRSEFSLDDTIKLIYDYYGDELDQKQKRWLENANHSYGVTGEEFLNAMRASGLFKWHDLWELPQYDYPNCAKTFAEIVRTDLRKVMIEYRDSMMKEKEEDLELE